MVTIEIDGIKTRVEEGTTVLQAARQIGIEIPTLCYHEALTRYASCRICIVELSIEKRGRMRTWIDASCVYPCQEGLIVKTNSEKVKKERKVILELLLSRAPESKILNELAEKYGARKDRFESVDKGKSNCILCGLCVRTCHELIHADVIGTAYRGIRKKVLSPYNIAQDVCIGCTACAFVCPTGAIKVKLGKDRLDIESWPASLEIVKCKKCGKPVGPKVYIEHLRKEVPLSDEVFELCYECRRKMYATTTWK